MFRQPNTTYIASISYGKDSLAMLEAIKLLGYPLDKIVSVQVWATDDIPADLPEMYAWKDYADKFIKERYEIDVERVSAVDKTGGGILSFAKQFYKVKSKGRRTIYGFPFTTGQWCNSRLKVDAIETYLREVVLSSRNEIDNLGLAKGWTERKSLFGNAQNELFHGLPVNDGQKTNIVQYIGIASDETKRIERHKDKKDIVMPLVDIGWTEADCRALCEKHGWLSPVYTEGTRDGCWFCHNQGVAQLRRLRKNYPQLWEILMKWDLDSPIPFKADGHTVHDYDKRFELEDKGLIDKDDLFRWDYLTSLPPKQLDMFKE